MGKSLLRFGPKAIPDANALWRGTTRPRGCAFLRQSMQTKEQQMKSKTKNKLVAFVKEAIRAAVAAIMGVAGAALAGCTAVTTPADASHTIGVVGFGVPFGIQVNK